MACHNNTQSHNLFILVMLTLVSFSSFPAWSQQITTVDSIHDLTAEDLHSSKELTIELFHDWMEKHDKVYDKTYEMLMRYEYFKDNVHHVVERNSMMRTSCINVRQFAMDNDHAHVQVCRKDIHGRPCAALVKEIMIKNDIYNPKEEEELGQEMDMSNILRMKHSQDLPEEKEPQLFLEQGDSTTILQALNRLCGIKERILDVLLDIQ